MRVILVTHDPYPALIGEMRRLGHVATVETDPAQAGRVLAQEQVDVLAVEASRLAMDVRWLERLRASSAPGLMLLGLASSREEAELAPLLAAGVDEYLVAPFEPGEVKARLTLLEQRRVASEQSLRERGAGEVARLAASACARAVREGGARPRGSARRRPRRGLDGFGRRG